MINPTVVTSKAAQKDFDNIKAIHASVVQSISDQTQKVAVYRQQKAAELQNQQTMKIQMDKEKMVADSQAKKDAVTFAQKQSELDIKRAALSAV